MLIFTTWIFYLLWYHCCNTQRIKEIAQCKHGRFKFQRVLRSTSTHIRLLKMAVAGRGADHGSNSDDGTRAKSGPDARSEAMRSAASWPLLPFSSIDALVTLITDNAPRLLETPSRLQNPCQESESCTVQYAANRTPIRLWSASDVARTFPGSLLRLRGRTPWA